MTPFSPSLLLLSATVAEATTRSCHLGIQSSFSQKQITTAAAAQLNCGGRKEEEKDLDCAEREEKRLAGNRYSHGEREGDDGELPVIDLRLGNGRRERRRRRPRLGSKAL